MLLHLEIMNANRDVRAAIKYLESCLTPGMVKIGLTEPVSWFQFLIFLFIRKVLIFCACQLNERIISSMYN